MNYTHLAASAWDTLYGPSRGKLWPELYPDAKAEWLAFTKHVVDLATAKLQEEISGLEFDNSLLESILEDTQRKLLNNSTALEIYRDIARDSAEAFRAALEQAQSLLNVRLSEFRSLPLELRSIAGPDTNLVELCLSRRQNQTPTKYQVT